ncbi:MAG: hypothetical protein HKN70_11775 [Gammaproteobacteria bacterium]|nr:hypothetical protein [Gammaproteobacteria bacterium]
MSRKHRFTALLNPAPDPAALAAPGLVNVTLVERLHSSVWLVLLCIGVILQSVNAAATAIPVELHRSDQGWELRRGGAPFVIRGAGGTASLQMLAAAGANSVRTWGADDIAPLLDEAHRLGLSVTVGIWLGHERHGFDYNNKSQVAAQLEKARAIVQRYKDHPAVLLWGIGNEMEGFGEGDDPAIWTAVNAVAAMVKELDPAHPTMAVTAEIGGGRIAAVHRLCPAIDIHGINSYGGAPSLLERLKAAGASKPIVLTEFGPPGPWEVAKTKWGAPMEPSSTAKAEHYRRSYLRAVQEARGVSLGSYVFHWGSKMEATATWFGMFLQEGARLAAVDVMTELWSGSLPDDLAPRITSLVIDGDDTVNPRAKIKVGASVSDPEGGPVRVHWVLRAESGDYLTGGDYRPALPDIEGAVLSANVDGAIVRMPEEPGPYRLFLYAYDKAGNAATANLPVLVKGTPRTPMPVPVYTDRFEGMPWAPSGWMGATEFLTLSGDYEKNPQEGTRSIRMRYTGTFGWVGVAWQHPANNWGEQNGGFDLTGATHLEVWARGEYGGERISIGVGLLGAETAHPDSGKTKIDNIVLKHEWQRYRIPLRKIDLSSIKTGFVVTLSGRRTPVTVYLDNIRYVR